MRRDEHAPAVGDFVASRFRDDRDAVPAKVIQNGRIVNQFSINRDIRRIVKLPGKLNSVANAKTKTHRFCTEDLHGIILCTHLF